MYLMTFWTAPIISEQCCGVRWLFPIDIVCLVAYNFKWEQRHAEAGIERT